MSGGASALLLIDCQRAFIDGSWARRMCSDDPVELRPLIEAFELIAALLSSPRLPPGVPILASQCPFSSTADRELFSRVGEELDRRGVDVTRVVKPGNDILDADGASSWIEGLGERDVRTLVIGGCTLTSCVRVSAIEVKKLAEKFEAGDSERRELGNSSQSPALQRDASLRVCVDLSLCGARASNYRARCAACLRAYMSGATEQSCDKDGCVSADANVRRSPVDVTLEDLRAAGVEVVDSYVW